MNNFTAGISSSLLSSILVSPLDVLRTRNQAFNIYNKGIITTLNDVLKKEGIK